MLSSRIKMKMLGNIKIYQNKSPSLKERKKFGKKAEWTACDLLNNFVGSNIIISTPRKKKRKV